MPGREPVQEKGLGFKTKGKVASYLGCRRRWVRVSTVMLPPPPLKNWPHSGTLSRAGKTTWIQWRGIECDWIEVTSTIVPPTVANLFTQITRLFHGHKTGCVTYVAGAWKLCQSLCSQDGRRDSKCWNCSTSVSRKNLPPFCLLNFIMGSVFF